LVFWVVVSATATIAQRKAAIEMGRGIFLAVHGVAGALFGYRPSELSVRVLRHRPELVLRPHSDGMNIATLVTHEVKFVGRHRDALGANAEKATNVTATRLVPMPRKPPTSITTFAVVPEP
jgi:hypothetical protein